MEIYQVWVNTGSAIEHTTLREDEWMSLDVDTYDADAAIEEAGWCGTFGELSGNRVVLQSIDEPTIRTEALSYLKGH